MLDKIGRKFLVYAILGLLFLSILLVCFLSWKSNPNLGELSWIPRWLSHWGDLGENSRKRTAIPFFFMGLGVGVVLILTDKKHILTWLKCWILMILLVVQIELGQFLLPTRHPDVKDILWGTLGSGFGLILVYVIGSFSQKLRKGTVIC